AVENWIQKIASDPSASSLNVMTPRQGDKFLSPGTIYISWSPNSNPTTTKAYLQERTNDSNIFVELGEALPTQKGSIYWSGDVGFYGNRLDFKPDSTYRIRVVDIQAGVEGLSGEFSLVSRDEHVGTATITLDRVGPSGNERLDFPAEGK